MLSTPTQKLVTSSSVSICPYFLYISELRHFCGSTTREQPPLRLWAAPDAAPIRREPLQFTVGESSAARTENWAEELCKENPVFRTRSAASLMFQAPCNFQMGNCEIRKCVLKRQKETQNLLLRKGEMALHLKENAIVQNKFFSLKNQESVS